MIIKKDEEELTFLVLLPGSRSLTAAVTKIHFALPEVLSYTT